MTQNNQIDINEKEITEIIADRLGIPIDTVNRDSYLFDDLNASKLEVADIIQTLEDKYLFKFNLEEINSFQTVGDIIDYIVNNVDWPFTTGADSWS